jgi:hypothetical protein
MSYAIRELTSAPGALVGLPAAARHVLDTLARFADDDGKCWPSVATLSEITGQSERSVQRAISAAIKAGYLTTGDRKGGRNRSTVYALNIARMRSNFERRAAEKGAPNAPFAEPAAMRVEDGKGDTVTPFQDEKGCQSVKKGCQSVKKGCQFDTRICQESVSESPTPSLRSGVGTARTRRGRLEPIPDDWQPDEQLVAWAIEHARQEGEILGEQDVRDSAGKFADHHRSRGTKFADPGAGFRNWWRTDCERTRAKRQTRRPSGGSAGTKAVGLQAALDRMRRNGQHLKADLTERFAERFGTQGGDVFDVTPPNEQIARGKPT